MQKKEKLCYMDTGSFTVYIKTEITENTYIQKILKQGFTLRIMNQIDHCLKGKIK